MELGTRAGLCAILLTFSSLLQIDSAHGLDCPTDPQELLKLIQEFENREACKQMSFYECHILMGASVSDTIGGLIMAKKALIAGSTQMPAGSFQCNAVKAQFDLREILLPKAYAFTNACIYVPAQNPEQAARDYIQAAKKELERQIAELREQTKEKQLKINSKPDTVAALENKVNQMKQAITGNSAGSENASNLFREERQRVLFDAAEKEFGAGDVQEARRLYEKHAVNGELSELRKLPPDERKLITQFHQAANKVNSSIQKKSDREILAQLQGELGKVTEESMRAKDAIEPEIKRLETRIALTFSRVNQLAGLENKLRSGTKTLTKEMLLDILSVPVPLVSKTPQGIVTAQSVLASVGEKMPDPGKGTAFQHVAQKLGINPALQAQGKILARRLAKKVVGGIMSASAGLAMADGNDDILSLDQNKKCMKEHSSSRGNHYEGYIDFDENCKPTVDVKSQKFADFLALPSAVKVDLLANDKGMLREVYCKMVAPPPLSKTWNISCDKAPGKNQFTMVSHQGIPQTRSVEYKLPRNSQEEPSYTVTQIGGLVGTASPQDVVYKSDPNLPQAHFRPVTKTSDGKKSISGFLTPFLNEAAYDFMNIASCCQGTDSEYCSYHGVNNRPSAPIGISAPAKGKAAR